MNTEAYPDEENIYAPAPNEYGFTSSGGGMFAGSQYFTIAGGTAFALSNRQSMDSGYTDTKHQVNLEPQTANDPRTGGGFIHRIFGVLQHTLVVEVDSDNIDTDPISPFLV
ncbi:hypothetical protein B0H16DRAFT_1889505 [Mycena metata]|uniref:Uncharacterized protein n=1 Tax=Mycena metata TaxID=1033252 RepID=A0AAD7N4C4_9AGAR|nr:hypothetical protein B0H16DRAFT_1889505 [Mycena metata]